MAISEAKEYEIIETRYQPNKQRKLDFLGTFEQARKKALEDAKNNVGVRYAVFRQGGIVAEFQAYYRTTVTCPKCGEVIPIT